MAKYERVIQADMNIRAFLAFLQDRSDVWPATVTLRQRVRAQYREDVPKNPSRRPWKALQTLTLL
jgi:hypothetical protein